MMEGSILKSGFENDEAKTLVMSFAGQGIAQVVGFEWVNFFSERPVKVVCVRDVQKAYYMGNLYGEGGEVISSGVDSHVELFRGIIEESKCERVIMTGSSLGGYAAALYGVLLNVDYALAYSSQTFIREHPRHGKNDRPHLAEWARRAASGEDQERYFDLADLNYDNFTGKLQFHWSTAWRDMRYIDHIKEFRETYDKNGSIAIIDHPTISSHSKLCKKLKNWGVLAQHFDGIIV